MGINTGILHNAEPLTATRIAELEREVLEGGKSYAYLDQTGKLCFAMQRGVDGIKDLAWNNAYELTNAGSILTKKAYKKTGLKTFVLDSIYTKPSLNASWTVGEIPIFEFDGSIEGRPYVYSDPDRHDGVLVKVSDSVLTSQMLLGSTLTYITGEHGADVENTVLLDSTEYVCSIIGDNGTEEGCLVSTIDGEHIVSVSNSWLLPDFFNWDIELEPGTYFMVYSGEAAEVYGFSKVYTKSISCLTIADATNPTTTTAERLEGDGQEFYTLAPSTLSFRSTAPLSEFQDVQINGQTVNPSNYTLEEGSTIVTFPIDYLKTLNMGSYEVAVASDSKTVKGDFTVAAPDVNEHGFYYNQPYTAFVPVLNQKVVFYFCESGTLYRLNISSPAVYKSSYTVAGNTITFKNNGSDFTFKISDGGLEMRCQGPWVQTFSIGDEDVFSDGEFLYTYSESLNGFKVTAMDKTKHKYGAIKTNFYRGSTVALDGNAFTSNRQLTNLPIIPTSVTMIGSSAFSECKSLTSVIIPDSITTLEMYSFGYCDNLTKVEIPASVTTIKNRAFFNCLNLGSVIFKGTIEQWNNIEFTGKWNEGAPVTYVQCTDGQVAL